LIRQYGNEETFENLRAWADQNDTTLSGLFNSLAPHLEMQLLNLKPESGVGSGLIYTLNLGEVKIK
jgi:hypothetical protein